MAERRVEKLRLNGTNAPRKQDKEAATTETSENPQKQQSDSYPTRGRNGGREQRTRNWGVCRLEDLMYKCTYRAGASVSRRQQDPSVEAGAEPADNLVAFALRTRLSAATRLHGPPRNKNKTATASHEPRSSPPVKLDLPVAVNPCAKYYNRKQLGISSTTCFSLLLVLL